MDTLIKEFHYLQSIQGRNIYSQLILWYVWCTPWLKLQSIQIPLTFATFKAQVLDTLTKNERTVSKSLDQTVSSSPSKMRKHETGWFCVIAFQALLKMLIRLGKGAYKLD